MHRAGELRREQTPAEAKLWAYLRAQRANGVHFRRQHAIGGCFGPGRGGSVHHARSREQSLACTHYGHAGRYQTQGPSMKFVLCVTVFFRSRNIAPNILGVEKTEAGAVFQLIRLVPHNPDELNRILSSPGWLDADIYVSFHWLPDPRRVPPQSARAAGRQPRLSI